MIVTRRRLYLLGVALWSLAALFYLGARLRQGGSFTLPSLPVLVPKPASPESTAEVAQTRPAAPAPVPPPDSPRISLIVIWENRLGPDARPDFPNFIQSFAGANRPYVELLWISVRQDGEERCGDPTELMGWDARERREANVKVMCMSRLELWTRHRDYFCSAERWECSPDESENVLRTMLERHDSDWYHSYFRIYRGYVFHELIPHGVEWWGWADHDTFLGNFRTQFPWEATAYDVFIPSGPDEALVHLRPQLAFFRMDWETEYKLLQYPDYLSPTAYLAQPIPDHAAMEEAHFSAFILREPSISFLTLPHALTAIPPNMFSPTAFKFSTLAGTYAVYSHSPPSPPSPPLPAIGHLPILTLPSTASRLLAPQTRFFSSKGFSRQVEMHAGAWPHDVWFPVRYATHYNHWHPIPEGWRRIVGRGGGYRGGPQGVWERLEPPREGVRVTAAREDGEWRGEFEVTLVEGLYVHWFEEKYNAPWFPEVGRAPIRDGQALVTAERYGAEIWDVEQGEVIWKWQAPDA